MNQIPLFPGDDAAGRALRAAVRILADCADTAVGAIDVQSQAHITAIRTRVEATRNYINGFLGLADAARVIACADANVARADVARAVACADLKDAASAVDIAYTARGEKS